MEPMTLGTPSNSGPSSPVTSPGGGSSYLPSFLLGEPTNAAGLPASTSPKLKRNGISDTSLFIAPRHSFNQTVRNQQVSNSGYSLPNEKSQGPPIKGLFDTLSTPNLESKSTTQPDSSQYLSVFSKNHHETTPYRTSSTTPSDLIDTTWVTVFGYPPAAASYILKHMAQCGHVLDTRAPATGNWMHVQFATKLDVKRALANNGKVFSGSVMIGVILCRDQNVLSSNDKTEMNSPTSPSTLTSIRSPQSAKTNDGLYPNLSDTSRNCSDSAFTSPQRFAQARSLTAIHDTEVYTAVNTPQKNTGLVSKAMEYVFGW